MHPARPASSAGAPPSSALPGMRLTELLDEVQERLDAVGRTQGRVQHLLDAFLSVSTGLDLDTTLRRIVEAGHRAGRRPVRRAGGAARRRWAGRVHPRRHRRRDPRAHGPPSRGQGGARPAHHRALSAADPRPGPAPLLGRLPPEPPADAQLPRGSRAGAGRGLRQPLPDGEGARGRSRPRTRPSSPHWPVPPASPSTTPGCTRRARCGGAGCPPCPTSAPLSWTPPHRPRRWG